MATGDRPPLTFEELNLDPEERDFRRAQAEDEGFLSTASKIALLGVGTQILSRNVLKTDLISYAAHYLGKFYDRGYVGAAHLGRAVRKNPFTGRPQGSAAYLDRNANIGASSARQLDIHHHIGEALELLTSPNIGMNIETRSRLLKEAFENKYSQSVPHYFDENLRRLQIGDVLDNQQKFSEHFGGNRFKAIKQGVEKGFLHRDHILDKNVFIRKGSEFGLVDARMRDPKNLIRSTLKNFNPLNVFGPALDFLESPAIAVMAPGTRLSKDVHLKSGQHIFAFGDIYKSITADKYTKVDVPFSVIPVRAGGKVHEALAATTGELKISDPDPKTFWGMLQKKLGIGRHYRTKDSMIESFVLRPFVAAYRQGQGTATPKLFKYEPSERAANSALEFLSAEHGVVSELGSRAGKYPLRGKFSSLADMRFFGGKPGRSFSERLQDEVAYHRLKTGSTTVPHGTLFNTTAVESGDIAVARNDKLNRGDFAFGMPSGGRQSIDNPLPFSMDMIRSGVSPEIAESRAAGILRTLDTKDVNRIMQTPVDELSTVDKRIYDTLRQVRATSAGELTTAQYASHTYVDPYTVLKGGANYLALRLNSLIGFTAGIGFKPSSSPLVNWGRVAAVPFLGLAGLRTAQYADYQLERTFGFSPVKTVAGAYTDLRVKQQEAREQLGLKSVFDRTEQIMPGFQESGFGFIVRHGVVSAGTLSLMMRANPLLGIVAGVAGYGAVGGTDIAQASEELKKEYSGERLVEVRKARFWGFGKQPFEGGRADYMTPSWYQKLVKDPETYGVYGSKSKYWANHANVFGIPFPTPENIFGIKNLLDPYKLEKDNYYNRPYPATGGMFDEFPIFGTVLNESVGELFKPRKRMHRSEDQARKAVTTNIYNTHLPANAAAKLQMESMSAFGIPVAKSGSLDERMQHMVHKLTEPLGFYKFLMERWAEILPEHTFTEADAGAMGSTSRSFYNSQFGGMFGMTEMLRRYLLPEEGDPSRLKNRVNPIRNTMPDWLPGIGSQFNRDQYSWTDFHMGDPYVKIHEGESRLPGKGYEKLHGLHSGIPGVYSPVDRFLVLSNVAPFSEGYNKYKAQTMAMAQRGQLDGFWMSRVQQALEFEERKKTRFDYHPRQFTSEPSIRTNLLDFKKDLSAANQQMSLSGFERFLGAGWETLGHDVLANIPYVGAKLAPFYSPLEHYQKFQLYGSETALWHEPWADIIRPAIHETIAAPAPIGALKGATLGWMLGGSASPFRMFNPFSQLATPALTGYGAIAGSAAGWMRTLRTGGATAGGYIPSHIQRERDVEEYFDKIRYLRARLFEERAMSVGDSKLASIYRREAGSTYTGLVGGAPPSVLRRAMSRRERAYFDAFSNAPASERSTILESVPSYVGDVYRKIWGMQSNLDGRTIADADAETLEYFREHVMPAKNSPVWHPDVPMQAIKAAYLDSGVNGISDSFSKFDVYPRTLDETRISFPQLYSFVPDEIQHGLVHHVGAAISEAMMPFDNGVRAMLGHGSSSANIYIEDTSRYDQSYAYLQQMLR